jgi:glutaconate CoA-transferase, subunit A
MTAPGPVFVGLEGLAAEVRDGQAVALAKPECGTPMALVRRLIALGRRELRLLTVPTGGLAADLLIGAGCVREVETAGISLGELGGAPCFARAVRTGAVRVRDSTCPAIYAALQAAEKGIPFMPLRGLIGSDLLAGRADVRILDNPFADGPDPIVLLPTLRPDVALIHAPLADSAGNVWIGRHRPLMLLAHAAERTLVTVEEIVDDNLLDDPLAGPATIPGLYLHAIALAPRGAWPQGLAGRYEDDADHLAFYAERAATPEGFAAYLEAHVLAAPACEVGA